MTFTLLILWFSLTTKAPVHSVQVEGFSSKPFCEAAGKEIAERVPLENHLKITLCVRVR